MKDGLPWRVRRAKKGSAPKPTPKPTARKVSTNHNPHAPRGIKPWAPLPKQFRGKVFNIVGGGPSLKSKHTLHQMRHACYSDAVWIAVNNSYKIAEWCDILHFADCEWWRWNGAHVLKTWPADRFITTATSDVAHVNDPRIKRFWRNRNEFSEDPAKLHGWDSGTQAVNLAFHLGASKIVLWGIDMQVGAAGETQWHSEHLRPTLVSNYKKKFAPSLAESVRTLQTLGIPVVRATEPGIPEAPYEPVTLK